MCDYSLHHVAWRPAKVGDKLVTTEFATSRMCGFAAVGEHGAKLVIHDGPPKVAVCLLPGTQLAFDDDVRYDAAFFGKARVKHKVACFRHTDLDDPDVQHDALEFPDGQVLKVARLAAGQTARVLQLPAVTQCLAHVEPGRVVRSSESRVALNRASRSGTAAILLPNQGTVMLWRSFRSTAISLSAALAQSFRRLKAHKQLGAAPPAGVDAEKTEASFAGDVLPATLPEKPATQKLEKQIGGRG